MEKELIINALGKLKKAARTERKSAKDLKNKVGLLFDMATVFFKHDIFKWEELDKFLPDIKKTMDECDVLIEVCEKVEALEEPVQPWGEIIPERINELMRQTHNLHIASTRYIELINSEDVKKSLNEYSNMLISKLVGNWEP